MAALSSIQSLGTLKQHIETLDSKIVDADSIAKISTVFKKHVDSSLKSLNDGVKTIHELEKTQEKTGLKINQYITTYADTAILNSTKRNYTETEKAIDLIKGNSLSIKNDIEQSIEAFSNLITAAQENEENKTGFAWIISRIKAAICKLPMFKSSINAALEIKKQAEEQLNQIDKSKIATYQNIDHKLRVFEAKLQNLNEACRLKCKEAVISDLITQCQTAGSEVNCYSGDAIAIQILRAQVV